jgi:hypothetical protein
MNHLISLTARLHLTMESHHHRLTMEGRHRLIPAMALSLLIINMVHHLTTISAHHHITREEVTSNNHSDSRRRTRTLHTASYTPTSPSALSVYCILTVCPQGRPPTAH